jgi:molybdopterin synthase catalytic subunit
MTHQAGIHEKGKFSINDLMKSIRASDDFTKTGAVGLFIGVARGENNEGQKVQKLTLEAYEEKANEVLEKICDDLQRKPGIVDVQIHHLIGDFNVGEDLVYVSVAGSHRPEVFAALREAVERYKHEVPVFKKEEVVDEKGLTKAVWISEKQEKDS